LVQQACHRFVARGLRELDAALSQPRR